VRAGTSLTDSAVAVGLNAVMIARPRASASTKSGPDPSGLSDPFLTGASSTAA
jgi:hypothetical protein